jgi:hypothetical protein
MINDVIIIITYLGVEMARGGVRSNSGAKGKWKHGKTKLIRVPEELADQILEYAHKLDENANIESVAESKTDSSSVLDSVSKSNIKTGLVLSPESESNVINLAGISIRACNGKSAVYLEDLAKAGYTLYPERLGQIFKALVPTRFRR